MEQVVCPFCGSLFVSPHDKREKMVWDFVDQSAKKVRVITPRYNCKSCDKRFSVQPEGLMPSVACTVKLADVISLWAMDSTFSTIAKDLSVISESEVKRIYRAWVKQKTDNQYAKVAQFSACLYLHTYEIRHRKFLLILDIHSGEPIDFLPCSTDAVINSLKRFKQKGVQIDVDDAELRTAIENELPYVGSITSDIQFIAKAGHFLQQECRQALPQQTRIEKREYILDLLLLNRETLSKEQSETLLECLEKHPGVNEMYCVYQRFLQLFEHHDPEEPENTAFDIRCEINNSPVIPETKNFLAYAESVYDNLLDFLYMEEMFFYHWSSKGSWRKYIPPDYFELVHKYLDGYIRTYGTSSELICGRILFNLYNGITSFDPEYTILGKNGN